MALFLHMPPPLSANSPPTTSSKMPALSSLPPRCRHDGDGNDDGNDDGNGDDHDDGNGDDNDDDNDNASIARCTEREGRQKQQWLG